MYVHGIVYTLIHFCVFLMVINISKQYNLRRRLTVALVHNTKKGAFLAMNQKGTCTWFAEQWIAEQKYKNKQPVWFG